MNIINSSTINSQLNIFTTLGFWSMKYFRNIKQIYHSFTKIHHNHQTICHLIPEARQAQLTEYSHNDWIGKGPTRFLVPLLLLFLSWQSASPMCNLLRENHSGSLYSPFSQVLLVLSPALLYRTTKRFSEWIFDPYLNWYDVMTSQTLNWELKRSSGRI